MNWWIARLREPSTWRGIVWIATALGVTLRPEVWEQITVFGMAGAGLLGVLTRDRPTTVQIQLPPVELVGKSEADRAVPGADADPQRRDSTADGVRHSLPSDPPSPTDRTGPGWNG